MIKYAFWQRKCHTTNQKMFCYANVYESAHKVVKQIVVKSQANKAMGIQTTREAIIFLPPML